MTNERKLIDYINDMYSTLEKNNTPMNNRDKMIFETGVAKGIAFILNQCTELCNIDLTILGQYQPNEED